VTSLHEIGALDLAAEYAAGSLSPVEAVDAYLERSAALGDGVGAFVRLTEDLAHRQARASEARWRDGRPLSPLDGVPVPIKDLHFVAGERAQLGSVAFDLVPEQDDNVVLALKDAGTICTGATNTPEFGLPCYTEPDPSIAAPARTPWDLSRTAGGSSGGAAAAVAAGLAPVAQGSDGGGSIRIPASCCGLVGLKTSRGRVSNGPLRDAVGDLPVNGPLGRNVADVAALLDVMARPFPGDPYAAPAPASTFLVAAGSDPGRLRIGRFARPVITDVVVDGEHLAAWESASAALDRAGHLVEDIDPPFPVEAVAWFETLWCVLACLTPIAPEREDDLQPLTRWLRERGRQVGGLELAQAISMIRLLARLAQAATDGYDAVLTPALALPPPAVGWFTEVDPADNFERQKQFTPFTAPYNVTGQPALAVPWSIGSTGLPISVQLVGRMYAESSLLSLGSQLEVLRPAADLWRTLRPAFGWS
jgi:amidase